MFAIPQPGGYNQLLFPHDLGVHSQTSSWSKKERKKGGTAGCWETNCIPCFIHWLIHLVYTHNSFMKLAHFNDPEIMTKYSTTNLPWQLTNHIPSFYLSKASWAAAYTTGSSACISANSVLPSGSQPHQISFSQDLSPRTATPLFVAPHDLYCRPLPCSQQSMVPLE